MKDIATDPPTSNHLVTCALIQIGEDHKSSQMASSISIYDQVSGRQQATSVRPAMGLEAADPIIIRPAIARGSLMRFVACGSAFWGAVALIVWALTR